MAQSSAAHSIKHELALRDVFLHDGNYMSNQSHDQRAFTRVGTAHPAEVTGPDGVVRQGVLRDVAITGVFIAGVQLPVQSPVRVRITLNVDAEITGEGHVARQTSDGIGVTLELVGGTESYEHLHKLVLYNTRTFDQTSRVVGEISRVGGLRAIDPLAPPPA